MNTHSGLTKLLLAVLLVLTGCGQTGDQPLTPEKAQAIAREAYVYGFPMVMNLKTINNYVLDEQSPDYKGPFNQLSCSARLFTPQDKAVVTPNSDTPYCMFWLNLRAEPQVLSVPEMDPKRFYHFQLVDLYTHNFGYVGTLSTGNGAGKYLIAGPDWKGDKPEGIQGVLHSETEFIFCIVRTQLFGPEDLEAVKDIQDSFGLEPLSTFLGTAAPAAGPMPQFPEWEEGSQFDDRFFGYLDFMMTLLEKPGPGEKDLWEGLARLGIGPDGTFNMAGLPADIQDALKAGIKEGFGDIEQFIKEYGKDPLASAKIFGTREFLTDSAKTHYGLASPALLRAVAAHMGLYGNSGAEAIYPTYLVDAEKQPLDATTNSYTLTFAEGLFPPVESFWSLTMYDGKTQLFIENPLDRYLLNSTMMKQFRLGEDGSLVIYIAKDSPGKELEGNWLPAPDGPLYMVLRLYGPKAEALEGKWTPPALQRVN